MSIIERLIVSRRLVLPTCLLASAAFLQGCTTDSSSPVLSAATAPTQTTVAYTDTVDLPDAPTILPYAAPADRPVATALVAEQAVVSGSASVQNEPSLSPQPAAVVAVADPSARDGSRVMSVASAQKLAASDDPAAPAALTALAAKPEAPLALRDVDRGELDDLIVRYASIYEVPVDLVRRVVRRESNFNPKARNRSYWGLMQIRHDTAQGMGYRGPASGLLDAETNLKYAVKYLRGAWLLSDGSHDRAVGYYARGYYYDAKRRGLLDETGLGRDRIRRRGA